MPTALTIRKVDGKPGKVYYPLEHMQTGPSQPTPTQLTVRMSAAALNHRDLFLRQHLYPGTTFGVPLLADGCGVVTATGDDESARRWMGKRVVLNPGYGWKDSAEGPEHPKGYAILGGTKMNPLGTACEELVVDAAEVEEAPRHLSSVEAAALPLTGLTAWRATRVKCEGRVGEGRNVLVTGIGGGVAIMALLFAVQSGAKVWVTSGSQEKIDRAKAMGAQGGVIYKEAGWEKKLVEMLPKERKYLDAIVDGAGGDVVDKAAKLLRAGGIVSVYGMTTGPKMPFLMSAVLKNIEVRGSTMGSRKEFKDMVAFVNEKGLKPVISKVVQGLDNLDGINDLFEDMKAGRQFGKLVIEISKDKETAKL